MGLGGWMRDTVDPDFASFVDARQGRWLRTAYLVYGDLRRAEELLLHAFTQLSVRWARVDDPDAFVQVPPAASEVFPAASSTRSSTPLPARAEVMTTPGA